MIFFQSDQNDSATITVYIQPRASANEICGVHGEALKLRITAPPVDGKANAKVIEFFAKLFKLPKSSITIVAGKQNRHKKVKINGADTTELRQIIKEAVRE